MCQTPRIPDHAACFKKEAESQNVRKSTFQRGMQTSTSNVLQLTEKCHIQKVCWRTVLMLFSTAEREPYELLTVMSFTSCTRSNNSSVPPYLLAMPRFQGNSEQLTRLPCLVVLVKFQFKYKEYGKAQLSTTMLVVQIFQKNIRNLIFIS